MAAPLAAAPGRSPHPLPPRRRQIFRYPSSWPRIAASVSPEGVNWCTCGRPSIQDADASYIKTVIYNKGLHPKIGSAGLANQSAGFQSSMYRHATSVLVAGLLMFHDSQFALASTELATVPPSEILGDPVDITSGLASAFLLIFFSELGDKTFFIAALLAARNSAGVVFAGTFGALAAMTVISVFIGRAFHYVDGVLPFKFGDADFPIDDLAAVFLLVYFGITTLLDAATGDEQKIKEEKEEAEVAISGLSGNGAGTVAAASTIASTFLLVFVAEWGDKSFFSTIALAAASSPLGVVGGSLAGHALATMLAVLGGSLIGNFLSEKVIAYIGGSLFLAFAATTLFEILN